MDTNNESETTETTVEHIEPKSEQPEPKTETVKDIKLVDVQINNENIALTMIVNFLALAQKRGAFTIDEAAKIYECIKVFQR